MATKVNPAGFAMRFTVAMSGAMLGAVWSFEILWAILGPDSTLWDQPIKIRALQLLITLIYGSLMSYSYDTWLTALGVKK